MIRTLLLLVFGLSSFSLFAQADASAVKRDLAERVQYTAEALQLDEQQTARLEQIYLRESAQLEKIASLKASDPDKYTLKLQAIRRGTAGSIRLLLRKEQIPLYYRLAAQWRLQEHQMRQQMQGASEMSIQEALVGTN